MKRLRTYSALAVSLLVISSCGGGSSAPAPTATGSSGPATGTRDDYPPHLQNAIWFTKNDNHDTTVTAACIGTATTYLMLGAQRKHKVRWYILNDPYNECEDLDIKKVELQFKGKKIWEANTDTLKPNGNSTKIDGRIRTDAADVPDGKYKYVIYYKGLPASPDPEIDIAGDCGGCGPQ